MVRLAFFGRYHTPRLESIQVSLNIPLFGSVKGTWKPNDLEKRAAWELYVELITRVSVIELKPEEGILREALESLYSFFQTTREILRKYGPDVAIPQNKGDLSFGKLAIIILNYQIRPVLSKWHTMLRDYEGKRKEGMSIKEHEEKWEHNTDLRNELNETRKILIEYSILLAKIANVEPLYERIVSRSVKK